MEDWVLMLYAWWGLQFHALSILTPRRLISHKSEGGQTTRCGEHCVMVLIQPLCEGEVGSDAGADPKAAAAEKGA
jgi:hypothetical protein